jgi:hypothetical protein
MNVTRDPDSILAAWIDEGPTDLPDATRRAILTALPMTPQARRGRLAPWLNTTPYARAAAALVVAVVGIGVLALLAGPNGQVGGPTPSSVPSPTATLSASAPPLPTLDAVFVSPSYGFQIRYPTGWTVTRGTGPWPMGTELRPGNPVSDAIVTPSGGSRVRFSGASIALPSGMTMDQFRAFAGPYGSPFNSGPCDPVAPLPTPLTLNGQLGPGASLQPVPAVVSINGCDALAELGGYIYDVEVMAGGRGYTFTIDGHISTSDALAWLAAITLDPASAPVVSPAPSPASTPASTPAASR